MNRRIALTCLFLAAFGATTGVVAQGSFEDAAGWSERFDSPARVAQQKPDEVVRLLALAPDAVVADIGSGTGFYAVRLARALPRGKVYGADTEPEMVRFLSERAKREGLTNIVSIAAAYTDPQLPEKVDLAFLANVHGLYRSPGDYYRTLRDHLKPGGRVAIIAARPGAGGGGPPENMRTAPEQVKRDFARSGYRLIAEHALLESHYFLVFAPER